jgi:hypothetical protein
MLLIFPPLVKPCEPPPGIAKIAGTLAEEGIECRVFDANIEGLLFLLGRTYNWKDTWYYQASKRGDRHCAALRNQRTYRDINRYKHAVMDLHRILTASTRESGIRISLSDYKDENLSPVKSNDLLRASEKPETNPFFEWFSSRLTGMIEAYNCMYVGFSLNYLSQALTAFAMIGFLKARFPEIKIILGGGLVTSWMRNPLWNEPFKGIVDFCIDGPAEERLFNFFGRKMKQPESVPVYEDFPLNDYLSPAYILPYSASTGCYWRQCTFCPEKAEGNPYRFISTNDVLRHISLLIVKNRPQLIHFLDNAMSNTLLKAIAKNPPGISWYGYVRINELLGNPDFCLELKKSGCIMLKLGIESGDQKVLDHMNKGFRIELASKVLQNLKAAGIAVYAYFLFGTPGETINEARKTLSFCARHQREITWIHASIFNMPLCDDTHLRFKKYNTYEGDLSLYADFIHPAGWDRKMIRRFLTREFGRNRAIAGILKATPPFFKENHAPLFVMNRSEVTS